jgi:CubicO group peptidase (beta-lactamase class C family)
MRLIRLCLFLTAVSVAAADELSTKMTDYLRAQESVNGFMGSVLVVKDGKTVLRTGIGMANLELAVPNAPQMKFRLGSISKQFTAVAIMQLEQNGKLKVEDTIDKHIPDSPEPWKKVTIHHLLSHTSGIASFTEDPSYRREMFKPFPLPELISRFRGKPLEFQPGSQYKYSNSGYVLLGDIIQRASGIGYEEYLRKNILDPLGLKDTGYDHPETILPHRASGYERVAGRMRNAAFLDMTQPHAAGALYSTVDDLYRWDQALYTDRVLPQSALQRMWTAVRDNYGYGWVISKEFGKTVIAHGGGINGFATFILRVPEEKIFITVLSNVESSKSGPIALALNSILHDGPYETPKALQAISINPAVFDAYEGRYEIRPGFVLRIWREGSRFLSQATGQQIIEIFPETETTFFAKVMEAKIVFVKTADGTVNEITIHQNGRQIPAKRVIK